MDQEPGLSDRYRMSSPWPLFVALGLAISEVGVFLGLFPLAVGGLFLFSGSVSGILREADYVRSPWRLMGGIGGALVVLGVGVYLYTGAPVSVEMVVNVLTARPTVAYRAVSIVVAGVLTIVAGVAGAITARPRP